MKELSNYFDVYKKLYPFLKPYIWRTLQAFLVTLPIGTLDAVIAAILKPYMDVVLLGKDGGSFSFFPALIIAFALVQSLFEYASAYLNTWVGQKITNDVKIALFRKLVYCDPVHFDRTTSGDAIFHYSGDADAACSGLLANARFFITRVISSIAHRNPVLELMDSCIAGGDSTGYSDLPPDLGQKAFAGAHCCIRIYIQLNQPYHWV